MNIIVYLNVLPALTTLIFDNSMASPNHIYAITRHFAFSLSSSSSKRHINVALNTSPGLGHFFLAVDNGDFNLGKGLSVLCRHGNLTAL